MAATVRQTPPAASSTWPTSTSGCGSAPRHAMLAELATSTPRVGMPALIRASERKNRPRGDRKSQEMSMHLRQVLIAAIKTELYPRSQIDIYVEVLQVWAA
ncbi:hypothetical protein MSG28_012714 [Choristoneura fumiferana]|uniref:Uncharacterized protein n=1 Tax=Choristoneura fumiferana TaxID=7141 RepID=A0ACC0JHU8_CHOFU|nr:hypothetical protein MSG28_012714 [Choristoneura fumiferana]